MTIPVERTNAILSAESLLRALAHGPSSFSRAELRALARSALRHYPTLYDIERLAAASPDVLARPQECIN